MLIVVFAAVLSLYAVPVFGSCHPHEEEPPSGGVYIPPDEPSPLEFFFENPRPGSIQSGIGVISGWACSAKRVTLLIDQHADGSFDITRTVPYGVSRRDLWGICSNTKAGFGLLFNWNLLGDGEHEVALRVKTGWGWNDIVARHRVTVVTLGEEYATGLDGRCEVADFPDPGDTTALVWQESQQNFVIERVE